MPLKPIAGTKSCQNRHVGMLISGKLKVVTDDGNESEINPDFYVCEPGHDASVLRDEPTVCFEFEDSTTAI